MMISGDHEEEEKQANPFQWRHMSAEYLESPVPQLFVEQLL